MIPRNIVFFAVALILSPPLARAFAPEEARAKLERLYQRDRKPARDDVQTVALTSVARRQREVEIDLLQKLGNSDDALPLLDKLWASEQTLSTDDALKAGDTLMEEYPTWVVPAYEQAVKAFQDGDLNAAYRLALKALQRKPWHIPTNYLMFKICWQQSDIHQAKYWAQRSMPRKSFHKRRQIWVELMSRQAQKTLEELEQEQAKFWQTSAPGQDWQ